MLDFMYFVFEALHCQSWTRGKKEQWKYCIWIYSAMQKRKQFTMCTKTQFLFHILFQKFLIFIKLLTQFSLNRFVLILRHEISSRYSPVLNTSWWNSLYHSLVSESLNQLIKNLFDQFLYSPVHCCLIVMIPCMTLPNETLPVFTSISFILRIVNSISLDSLYKALHSWPLLSTAVLHEPYLTTLKKYLIVTRLVLFQSGSDNIFFSQKCPFYV